MDLIKLLDIASPKNTKDTINLLITNYNDLEQSVTESVAEAMENVGIALNNSTTAIQTADEAKSIADGAKTTADEAKSIAIEASENVFGKLSQEDIVQTTGTATDKVMSQKIVTDLFDSVPMLIETIVDPTTYIMTTTLKTASGNTVSTGTVDLPLESMVVSGYYDSDTKKVILTLQSGSTVEFSIEDLIDGLASQTDVDNIINNTTLICGAEYGGFAAGTGASATNGGAVGRKAKAGGGGAVGNYAVAEQGGGAVGGSSKTITGGAVGSNAISTTGGAIGYWAKTSTGFAGGEQARAVDSSNNGIDAIQLGTGTNSTEKSLQVYDYTLMNADGSIPLERMINETTARENADSELQNQITANMNATDSIRDDVANIVNNTTKITNSLGGFAGGRNALASSGGAVGNAAQATIGGAVGDGAYAGNGGAVGNRARTNSGGAIGENTTSTTGGAVGFGAYTSDGGAVGDSAKAVRGGAVGYNTRAGAGFAGGYEAQTLDSSGNYINAIQLGTGNNSTEKTLQVYDDNIYDANTHTLTVTGAITDGTNSITVANTPQLDTENTFTKSNKFIMDMSQEGSDPIIIQDPLTGGYGKVYIRFDYGKTPIGYISKDMASIDGTLKPSMRIAGYNGMSIGCPYGNISFAGNAVIPGVLGFKYTTPTDLGSTDRQWKDLYLSGNLTDGTNATTIASIPVEIETTVDPTNYVMTTNLKNASGTVVSTGTVDLPLESVVVDGEYNAETKKIVLTLQNGNTIEFSVEDLINGLASQTDVDNIVNNTTLIHNSSSGFSAGANASAIGGGAVGYKAQATSGGAVGQSAKSSSGGAVGYGAKTSGGFAGGENAKAVDSSGTGIDAIQLGTGTNQTEKTLQVYAYTLMNADGTIPAERLANETTARETADSELQTAIDNIVNNTTLIHGATYGGFAAGTGANATNGGAVGLNAKASIGGAVGSGAKAAQGGAVGNNSDTVTGGAVGFTAYSLNGGAVGYFATTSAGFAGGYNAKTIDSNNNGIDAIQLGTGTNSNEKTLQIYNFQLMDASGNIPLERMANETTARESADAELQNQITANMGTIDSVSNDVANIINNTTKIANTNGGFAGGSDMGNYVLSTKNGGAIGAGASSTTGGAIGLRATATDGGAIGRDTTTTTGGAVGYGAVATSGFSGGLSAKSSVDAIQLGSGTNSTAGTLQVYNYQLMDSSGYVPPSRLKSAVLLWSGGTNGASSGTLTLGSSINNYKYLILEGRQKSSVTQQITTFVVRNGRNNLVVYLGANGSSNTYEMVVTLSGTSAKISNRQNAIINYIYGIE